jgi:hypothetical protein
MLSRNQLEMLEQLLNSEGVHELCPVWTFEEWKELRGAIRLELWNTVKPLRKPDQDLVAKAIAEGRLNVYVRPQPAASERITRFYPKPILAKDGDELLAALGLDSPSGDPS